MEENLSRTDRIDNVKSTFSGELYRGAKILGGIEGEPHYPYRGTARPSYTVQSVETTPLGPDVTATDGSGNTVMFRGADYSAHGIWEPATNTYDKMVSFRSSRAVVPASYRGSGDRIAQLEAQMEEYRGDAVTFRSATVEALANMAGEVRNGTTYRGTGGQSTTPFCDMLFNEFNSQSYRGIRADGYDSACSSDS